ncbi:MAG: YhbY family RNA-binding protein [Holophagales bacterium]|nr:YhbY family RNA-binding protein [Holophagales bacterium]
MDSELSSRQRKFLRGMAHAYKPLVHVGREGLSTGLLAELDRALSEHELVKVRYQEAPEREARAALSAAVEERLGCVEVGRTGHVAIFFRQQPDPEKRKIHLLGR